MDKVSNRLEATHFIEVWKNGTNKVFQSPITRISFLNDSLNDTKISLTLKTIAVWKIKLK